MEQRALQDGRLRLLGPARAESEGTELRFPDRKCLAIVAVLALDGPCTRARLADLLWDSADARRNLRRELHRLRDAGFEPFVAAEGDLLWLREAVQVDAAAFRASWAAGDAERALDLYAGTLLEGFDVGAAEPFQDWLAAQRSALAHAWRAAALARGEALEAAGRLRDALALANRLVEADLLQESHYRRAMALHGALGEREAALALYERCRRLLGRELGLKPLPETVALADRIRSGAAAPAAAPAPLPALQTLGTGAPLVGREPLLATLEAALGGRLAVLRGAAGIGKSSLLRQLASRRPGLQVHAARLSDRRVPFAALARWLRGGLEGVALPPWVSAEVARLLPALGAAPPPIASDAQRLRFFEALALAWRAAFGDDGALFDDWQFVDDASAGWWTWWFGQHEGGAVLVAERPLEALPAAATALEEALQSAAGRVVEVPPLAEDEMLALVRRLSGSAEPRRFAHRLWQATGGHPFYALETLQHLLQTEVIRVDAMGQWHTPYDDATTDYRELPIAPSVQAAVVQRLRSLDEAVQRLLEAASLTGDDFTLALVARASALGEWDALRALEAALHARVLARTAEPAGRFRFGHDLFAQAVAASLSPERRALLHRALAQHLAEEGAAPARVAAHFEAAGDAATARGWHLRALQASYDRLLAADMLQHAARVLALDPEPEDAVRAHLARMQALRLVSQSEAAFEAMEQALGALSPRHPLALRVLVAAEQSRMLGRFGRHEEAVQVLAPLLADPAVEDEDRAPLLAARGRALRGLGRYDEAAAALEGALALLGDEVGDAHAELMEDLSRLAMSQGDVDRVRVWAGRAAAAAAGGENPARLGAALMMCGVAELQSGCFEAAQDVLLRSRAVGARHGLVSVERGAILNLVSVWLAQGERVRAMQAVEEGFALSPRFASASERQAFVEARFQCRLDAGELGLACDAMDDLVRQSMEAVDRDRTLSGLSVALELPLAMHDVAAARRIADLALGQLGDVLGEQAAQVLSKAAALAAIEGDFARAGALLQRARTAPLRRPESRAILVALSVLASRRQGVAPPEGLQDLLADVSPESVSAESWALLLAQLVTLRAPARRQAQALEALASGRLPALVALQLHDALAASGLEPAAQGRALAAGLRASLAQRPREQALFDRRFERWV